MSNESLHLLPGGLPPRSTEEKWPSDSEWIDVSFWLLVDWLRGLELPEGNFTTWKSRKGFECERPFPLTSSFITSQWSRPTPSALFYDRADHANHEQARAFGELVSRLAPYDFIFYPETVQEIKWENKSSVLAVMREMCSWWKTEFAVTCVLVNFLRIMMHSQHNSWAVTGRARLAWWHPAVPYGCIVAAEFQGAAQVASHIHEFMLHRSAFVLYRLNQRAAIFIFLPGAGFHHVVKNQINVTNPLSIQLAPGKNIIRLCFWISLPRISKSTYMLVADSIDDLAPVLFSTKILSSVDVEEEIKIDAWNLSRAVYKINAFKLSIRVLPITLDERELCNAREIQTEIGIVNAFF